LVLIYRAFDAHVRLSQNSANANNLERARPIAQPNVANNQQQSHQATDSNNANENRREEFILDDDGQPVVGPPLRRPPAGWDARTNRNTVRIFLLIKSFSGTVHESFHL
jgi:hypothetical protein